MTGDILAFEGEEKSDPSSFRAKPNRQTTI